MPIATFLLAVAVLAAIGLLLLLVLRRRPGRLRKILLVEAFLVAAWILGGNLCAYFRERSLEASISSIEARTGDIPKELAARAAELGIPLWGEGGLERNLRASLSSFITEQAKMADGTLATPSPEVEEWFASAEGTLAAIERLLNEGPPLLFPANTATWRGIPAFGVRDLHTALVGSALVRVRAGRLPEALARLDAAWRLTDSFHERPETVARLIATSVDKDLMSVLRVAGPAPMHWRDRLAALGDWDGLLPGLKADTLELLRDVREGGTTARGRYLEMSWGSALIDGSESQRGRRFLALTGGVVEIERTFDAVEEERARARRPFYRYVQGPLEKPYLRLCATDHAAVFLNAISQASACGEEAPSDLRLAGWNLIEDDLSHPGRMSRMTATLKVEAELTALVLEARSSPKELSTVESRACPGHGWLYRVEPDGTATVRLDPNPFEPQEAVTSFRLR